MELNYLQINNLNNFEHLLEKAPSTHILKKGKVLIMKYRKSSFLMSSLLEKQKSNFRKEKNADRVCTKVLY